MAGHVAPAFDPGPHFAIGLAHRGLHPFDAFLDDLINRHAPLGLPYFSVAERLGKRSIAHAFQPEALAARVLAGEGSGLKMPTQRVRCLPVSESVNLKERVATPAVVMLT